MPIHRSIGLDCAFAVHRLAIRFASGVISKITLKSPARSRKHPSHSPERALMSPSPDSPYPVSARSIRIELPRSRLRSSPRSDSGHTNFIELRIRSESRRVKPPCRPESLSCRARCSSARSAATMSLSGMRSISSCSPSRVICFNRTASGNQPLKSPPKPPAARTSLHPNIPSLPD